MKSNFIHLVRRRRFCRSTTAQTPVHRSPSRPLGACGLALLLAISAIPGLFAIESESGKVVAAFDVGQVQDRSIPAMRKAARQFIDTLDGDLKRKALFPFQTSERAQWSNLPPSPDYAGVKLRDLSPDQLKAACELFAACLSKEGFDKTRAIMLGDDMLVRNPDRSQGPLFGVDFYWLLIFGDPANDENWGWQLDGHHLGLNLTVVGDSVTIAPSFIGAQPFLTEWGSFPKTAPMEKEVSQAFQLLNGMTEQQKKKAVVGDRRQGLEAGPGDDSVVPKLEGISGSELNPAQKALLLTLISNWTRILPNPFAEARQKTLAAQMEMDQMRFGWWGGGDPDSAVYYRIQSPNVLIEFAHQNLGGDPRQHLHSVYREPDYDYGNTLSN